MSDGWLPSGAANEGQPQDAASWMGVGPLHSIDEVAEGNEVMEKRERQEGITTEQAKGRTLRWQPLLPNLRRVNEAARRSGQTRFTALLHHVDVAALERAFRRQRRTASPGVDRVTVDESSKHWRATFSTCTRGSTADNTGPSRYAARISRKATAAAGPSAFLRSRTRLSKARWPRF